MLEYGQRNNEQHQEEDASYLQLIGTSRPQFERFHTAPLTYTAGAIIELADNASCSGFSDDAEEELADDTWMAITMMAGTWMADDTLLVEDAIVAADDNQMNDGIQVGEDTQMGASIHMASEIKKGEEPSTFRNEMNRCSSVARKGKASAQDQALNELAWYWNNLAKAKHGNCAEERSSLNYSAIFPEAKLSEDARMHLTIIKWSNKWVR